MPVTRLFLEITLDPERVSTDGYAAIACLKQERRGSVGSFHHHPVGRAIGYAETDNFTHRLLPEV